MTFHYWNSPYHVSSHHKASWRNDSANKDWWRRKAVIKYEDHEFNSHGGQSFESFSLASITAHPFDTDHTLTKASGSLAADHYSSDRVLAIPSMGAMFRFKRRDFPLGQESVFAGVRSVPIDMVALEKEAVVMSFVADLVHSTIIFDVLT